VPALAAYPAVKHEKNQEHDFLSCFSAVRAAYTPSPFASLGIFLKYEFIYKIKSMMVKIKFP
jgi:hypothetical protein